MAPANDSYPTGVCRSSGAQYEDAAEKARKVIGKKSSLYDPLRVALVVLLQVLATRFGRDDADCVQSAVN